MTFLASSAVLCSRLKTLNPAALPPQTAALAQSEWSVLWRLVMLLRGCIVLVLGQRMRVLVLGERMVVLRARIVVVLPITAALPLYKAALPAFSAALPP